MSRVARLRRALPTLIELWSGKSCPHEGTCACRTSSWCPKARDKNSDSEHELSMFHLAGCAFAYSHCCCRLLDEIEGLARAYVEQAGVDEPPVPLDVLSLFDPSRPVEIRSLPLKRYFGSTWFLRDEWVVYINSNYSPVVNNFTAFHEGFHIVCRSTGLAYRKADVRAEPINERLADYFAASILMPRDFVLGLWPDIRDAGRMASIFRVPQPAMEDWLTRLRISSA